MKDRSFIPSIENSPARSDEENNLFSSEELDEKPFWEHIKILD